MDRIIQEKEVLGEGRVGHGECWDIGLEINRYTVCTEKARHSRARQGRTGQGKEGRANISHNIEGILYCLSQSHHSILFWLMADVL